MVSAQKFFDDKTIDAALFHGNIIRHSEDMRHLITGHPTGFMVTFSQKTYGEQEWEKVYGFPNFGGYFLYENYKNEILGNNLAIGAHYTFFFLKRHLGLKIMQGLAMNTNPHDNITNNKNTAIGSRFLSNTNFEIAYYKENILDKFGVKAGILFTHFSNGRLKSPNSGVNSYNINLGVNYNFDNSKTRNDSISLSDFKPENIKLNTVLRSGFNESLVVGSGQKPFYHISVYADKRLGRKSAIQFGSELFLTKSFKNYIKLREIAYPEDGVKPGTDYKRISVFIGHELFINRLSVETQVGYYFYKPFKSENDIYDRVGVKYYITKNFFTGVSVKTHGFLAEATELVTGIRF